MKTGRIKIRGRVFLGRESAGVSPKSGTFAEKACDISLGELGGTDK